MATAINLSQKIFDRVALEFKIGLGKDKIYDEILKTTTIDEVYDMTDKLQQEQAKNGHLRHLSKIQPFLEGLNEYARVIEVFMQAKPEVLALIWGPIKLIIQWTSVLKQSFDAIINLVADIGVLLPEFKHVTSLFNSNKQMKELLALFFKDLLDFYLIALLFFTSSRWKYVFESVWPRQRREIEVVMDHINRITLLMRNEVRLEHIQAEHEHRVRALEHFKRTERSHQRQEYDSVRADISPPTYDEALYLIHSRTCPGTGKWILKDIDFKKWIDISDNPSQLLWLQGIPGSGKTYLTGTAITEARRHGNTLYALLSHTAGKTSLALSILHSLIFQLASTDDSIQGILVESTRANLKCSIEAATLLLTTLLSCVGAAYIVIDGLDEIAEPERCQLVRQLLQISTICSEARILVSSRPEFDISEALKDKATTIRVDQKNSGSIQTYVNQRKLVWFGQRQFLPEGRSQIESLLAPLAWKSKGMFIYAVIILNSIEDLEVHEICQELRALPESLDDVYGRILHRINNLNPTSKEKARRILGWVGCSPTPMTSQELQQALSIGQSDQQRSTRFLSDFNVTKICGPILETINGYIYFVHFTVKEYLFSPKIANSLDEKQAVLTLAECCVQYLCQPHHDQDISDEVLHENVLNGAYRLHEFSTSLWLGLIKLSAQLISSNTIPDSLDTILRALIAERENFDYEEPKSPSHPSDFLIFKSNSTDIYEYLCQTDSFRQINLKPDFSMLKGGHWTKLDPSTLAATSVRIFRQIDELLRCDDEAKCLKFSNEGRCQCRIVRWHYGQRPFKCEFLSCSFRRGGFSSRSLLEVHVKYHETPWKCGFPGCKFADGGFLSRRMRDDHVQNSHQETSPPANLAGLDQDSLQPLLFDLVLTEQIELVKSLIQAAQLSHEVRMELCRLVAKSGSLAMLKVIKPSNWVSNRCNYLANIIGIAAPARNFEICEGLIPELATFPRQRAKVVNLLSHILLSDSEELFTTWLEHVDLTDVICYASGAEHISRQGPRSRAHLPTAFALAQYDVIKATERRSWREEKLMLTWIHLDVCRLCGPRYLGQVLGFVAKSTCSLKLATFLLENGAEVDSRGDFGSYTPLHLAVRHTTAEAAELVMLLLVNGANPKNFRSGRSARRGYPIRNEIGAREISKWLGMTWDEVVLHAQEERAKLEAQKLDKQKSE